MSGNTKLLGFGPDNKVTFERWGKQATVSIAAMCTDKLRDAVFHKLPQKPPGQSPQSGVSYDEKTGNVTVKMSPDQAATMRAVLYSYFHPSAEPNGEEVAPRIQSWIEGLGEAVKRHYEYTNTEGEPGVESSPEG